MGESLLYDSRFTLNYSKIFSDVHQFTAGIGMTLGESTSESYSVTGEGITVDYMDFLGMASQYAKGGRPGGNESIIRNAGVLFNAIYTYDRRYFVDVSGKYDGSSQFGTKNRFTPIWSTGVGWNLHNESFVRDIEAINTARIRASYGITASQNFPSYLSQRTYQDFGGASTQGWYGVYLMAYGNEELLWQKSRQWNVGLDAELFSRRIQAGVDVYNKETDNLVADVNIPLSSGFGSYKSNIGKVSNRGIEVALSGQIIRNDRQNLRWTVGVKAMHNANKILKISNSLKELNERLGSMSNTTPTFLYKEGESMNTIYAVRSKGIDPSSGREIFAKIDGSETFTWDARDQVACGVAEPKLQGSINSNLRWKGVILNLIFGYRIGGYAYNSALASRVENINPYQNADRRALTDRWKQPGDVAKFKSVADLSPTYTTSRFIFKDNTFYGSSLNLGYEFPAAWARKYLSVSYLSLNGYAEDLFWASTIKRERGTNYPFSRKFSMSLTARF